MLSAWFIAGATATGKSAVAQRLAERLGCAVLSADSMLVYRGMDIGTAKPAPAERGAVPYFGLDLITPDQPFSTGLWLAAARNALQRSEIRGQRSEIRDQRSDNPDFRPPTSDLRPLIVAGGTGLYLKALTDGLGGAAADPAARARWQALYEREGLPGLRDALEARAPGALASFPDPANPRRLIRALEHLDSLGALPSNWNPPPVVDCQLPTADCRLPTVPIPVLRLPRAQLHARIARRVAAMFEAGLVDEVRALRRDFPLWSDTARGAIGYAEVCALLDGALTDREAAERTAARTRQLAKRQETWFRHQARAAWIDIDDTDPPERVAERVLDTWRQHGPTPVVSL
jgi:tRNA dimethylallyltransferase